MREGVFLPHAAPSRTQAPTERAAMPEEFTFPRNTGSYGYQVLARQDPSTSYGVVWHDPEVCQWVAEYPGNHPGSGGGIPGFASRKWAARFLYRYRKPQPSGRT
ncbi:hypothetical protein GCM10010478_16790 [Streptomyces erythrogriseus]|uniref:Uncharacterized protein n=2 Tax=Streptomyces erythrogriseus TaxID=284027 RepID=A0ABN3WKF7_9ACTN